MNANDSAFPVFDEQGNVKQYCEGLSKREYFAAKSMQGMLANSMLIENVSNQSDGETLFAAAAVQAADALIAELNKTKS